MTWLHDGLFLTSIWATNMSVTTASWPMKEGHGGVVGLAYEGATGFEQGGAGLPESLKTGDLMPTRDWRWKVRWPVGCVVDDGAKDGVDGDGDSDSDSRGSIHVMAMDME